MAWTEQDLADHYDRLKVRHEPEALQEAQPRELREAFIQEECVKFMEADGWRHLRTDPVSDRSRAKGFGTPGMADSLFMRPFPSAGLYAVELTWIEWKCGKNKARKDQVLWHQNERARGFQTWIANSDFIATVDAFRDFYAISGLMRRIKWW